MPIRRFVSPRRGQNAHWTVSKMALWLLFVIAGICASNGNPATVDHPLVYGNFAIKDKEGNVITQLAADLTPAERLVGKSCKSASNGNNVVECLEWDNGRKVEVLKAGPCMIVRHQFESKKEMLTTVDFGGARWFGGGEEIPQKWPLDKHVDLEHSMVTQEAKNRAIQDAVWFSSSGVLLHVKPGAPLFLKWNSTQDGECKGKICFRYIDQDPYRPRPGGIKTEEWFCSLGDAKKAFEFAVDNIYGKPTGYPDERMIKYPVWSTWAKFKAEINDSAVRSFADDIIRNGFTNGQFELDDMWETCYGSKIVDTKRFPDLKKLTLDLKAQNFRVTIWTHPFINTDCPATFNEAKDKGFLTKDMNGNVVTKWWNGVGGIVDFSKPDATDWFAKTHKQFLEDYGIDGFKFDAGETSWFPQLPDLSITPSMDEEYPNAVTASYVRMCATFNSLTEVRSAYYTQNLPIFLRMVDKDSRWGDDNGLKSLVTTLLQMNMVGYSLVLPDMIGGNAYNGEYADQELFLRWLEANTFMPALQYALVPWDYGDKSAETVQISKKFTDLHAEYSDIIIKAMQKNVADGSPVNPPIWWLDPADESALAEDTEYLVGEEILVAPVLEQGAVSRDIYLPKGSWRDMNNKDKVYQGPTTIVGYNAPLDTLPWFVIVGSDADKDGGNSSSSSKLMAPTVVSLLCLWYSLTMFR